MDVSAICQVLRKEGYTSTAENLETVWERITDKTPEPIRWKPIDPPDSAPIATGAIYLTLQVVQFGLIVFLVICELSR